MKTQLLAATIAALALTLPAQADSLAMEGEAVSVSIPYNDLDLSRPASADLMFKRVTKAASRACGGRPAVRFMRERKEFFLCVDDLTQQAVQELGAPLVTSLYEQDQGLTLEQRYAALD
jgi:UrcA family protein